MGACYVPSTVGLGDEVLNKVSRSHSSGASSLARRVGGKEQVMFIGSSDNHGENY